MEKYITEQASANNAGAGATAANQDSQPHEMEFKKIKKLIDEVIDRSGYNKVDLSVLFSFMDKWISDSNKKSVKGLQRLFEQHSKGLLRWSVDQKEELKVFKLV